MRRFVLLLVIGCLGFQAGLLSLACDEPCLLTDSASERDGSCPPLCATCGCCTLSAAPALDQPRAAVPRDHGVAVSLVPVLRPCAGRSPDIWHVPLT